MHLSGLQVYLRATLARKVSSGLHCAAEDIHRRITSGAREHEGTVKHGCNEAGELPLLFVSGEGPSLLG